MGELEDQIHRILDASKIFDTGVGGGWQTNIIREVKGLQEAVERLAKAIDALGNSPAPPGP